MREIRQHGSVGRGSQGPLPDNFHSANLEKADLSESGMRKTSFRYAKMSRTRIEGAKLFRADLVSADLSFASFRHSLVAASNFDSASLENADLRDADFNGNDYFEA